MFAVIVSIFLPSITIFASESPSTDTIILLGRVQVEWDGYAGKRQTDSSGFEILIKRMVTDPEELTEIFGVKPDAKGYFAVVNLPREGAYGFSKVKLENGIIPVSVGISRPVSKSSRVLDLGMMTLTVKVDGKIGVEIKGAGFTATTTSLSSQENPFIHPYIIDHFNLGGWLPVVKSDLEKRIKTRKLEKVIKQLHERADKFKQEGRFEAVVGEYLKILEIDPDNWRVKQGLRKLALKISDENAAKVEGAREKVGQKFSPEKSSFINPEDLELVRPNQPAILENKNENLKFSWPKRFPANVFLKFDGLNKAEAVYLKALRLFPDCPDNYGDPAGFYVESECPVQIEVILKEAGQKFSPEKSSFFALRELYQKRKDFSRTLANYKVAYNLQSDKTSLLADLIKVYNELGDFQPVTVSQKPSDLEFADIDNGYEPIEPCEPPENHLKDLKKGVVEDPTNAGYHAALAEYYTGYNLLAVAVKHYQLAVNNDLLNDYRLRILADAWLRLGNNEEAEKALLAACKVKPDSSLSVAKLALFYEFSKGVKIAEKVLLRAVRNYPKDLNLHFALARFYERQEELEKALIEVHKVLEFDGKKNKAHTLLGRIYKKMGRAEAAFQEFAYRESILRQKIAQEPQKEGHYNALAWFLADANINLDEALLMAWESKTLGWVYYQRGDYGRAVKYMNQAITEDGDRADCFFRLSMALSRVGKKTEAEAAFKTGKLKEPCCVLGLRAAGVLAQKPAQ